MTAKTAAMIPQCDIRVSECRETNMHLQAVHKLSYPLMLFATILQCNLTFKKWFFTLLTVCMVSKQIYLYNVLHSKH